MTILILGANGFLGSKLAEHLRKKGEDVVSLSFRPDRKDQFLEESTALLTQKDIRTAINAGASQVGKDEPEALEDLTLSNVYLPSALASLIVAHSPKTSFVNFGTSWQIGEAGESAPFNAYAASKAAAEPFLDHFALSGLKAATLRLYDTYGPGDPRRKIVNLIMDAFIEGNELPMSGGEQIIDLVHIDDVMSAVDKVLDHLSATETGIHEVYAVRSGKPVPLLDVVALIGKATGKAPGDIIKPGVYPYRPRERFALYADTPTLPGWSPKIDLAAGLEDMLKARSAS